MRTKSTFKSSAPWSAPEQLSIEGVSVPEDPQAQVRDPEEESISGRTFVTVRVIASWSQVFEGGDGSGSGSGTGTLLPEEMTNTTGGGNVDVNPRRARRNVGSGSEDPEAMMMTVREPDEDIIGYDVVVGLEPLAEEFGAIPNDPDKTFHRRIDNVRFFFLR